MQQDGLGMPGVAFDQAWGRVIARDSQNIRLLLKENLQSSIKFLDGFAFTVEVAVFAVHIGVFEMDEEIIVVVVLGDIALELCRNGLRTLKFGHADELGETFVHWIYGDRSEEHTSELQPRGLIPYAV